MPARRVLSCLFGLTLLLAGLSIARADTPYPVIGEPVVTEDSEWEALPNNRGYKLKSLALPGPEKKWPTALTMEGYDGASRPSPNVYLRMDDGELMALRITFGQAHVDYAFVQASTRGTECSGGSFNLYDRRHAWDGHHIVEWIAAQPWSNERVGMFGSSFPGQTAYWVATTQPPHLAAVSANLLHSDIYRDIFMPGGVQNYLFPTIWTYAAGPHRLPQKSFQNGTLQNDEICAQNQASRYSVGDIPQAQNEPAWAALRSVDDQWYIAHAALTYAPAIKIPYYQQSNWQDEQVGPRAVVLFNHINPTPREVTAKDGVTKKTVVPKLFVNATGDHGHGGYAGRDRWAWFDIWLRDLPDSKGLTDQQVTNVFEAQNNGTGSAVKTGNTWPFENTTYKKVFLGDGSLSFDGPGGEPDTYMSGIPRQNWIVDGYDEGFDPGEDAAYAQGLPDVAAYESPALTEQLVVAGPLSIDLYASIAGTDTDFFVSVADVYPDGRINYVQRGLLKASHRRIDPERSYYDTDAVTGETVMAQPYRPHTNPQPVMPGEIINYRIEIFPVGWIFRKDHKILVQVHTPPVIDGIWGYTPTHHQPAPVTIYHDAQYPSALLLPVVQPDGPVAPGDTPCPVPAGFPCVGKPVSVEP